MNEYSVSVDLVKWPIKFPGFTMSRYARDPFDGVHIRHWPQTKKKPDKYLLRSGAENELQILGEYEKGGPTDVRKPIALSFSVCNNILTWRKVFYVRETSDSESDSDTAWHQSFRTPSVVQTEASIFTMPEVSFPTTSKSTIIRISSLFLQLF